MTQSFFRLLPEIEPPWFSATATGRVAFEARERTWADHLAVRQQAYLRALQTIPNLSIHYGQFYANPKMMKLVTPLADGTKYLNVLHTEEKGTDVNIATHLLVDGFRDSDDMAAVLSNDSDLATRSRPWRGQQYKSASSRLPKKSGLAGERRLPKCRLLERPLRTPVGRAQRPVGDAA